MPRIKLRPYAVILELPRKPRARRREMTVRIWAADREDAMRRAPDIYAGTAVAAQHCPHPLP